MEQQNQISIRGRALIATIRENAPIKGRQLSELMLLPRKEVGRMISDMRKAYVNGRQNAVYIHLSKQGYTLEETPENLKYESMKRLKMGTSIIMNGKYVFSRYKSISLSDYHRLKIEFKPTTNKTIVLLSDTIGNEAKNAEVVC